MFTNKDIEFRTIFVINCINERTLRVSNGELLLEEYVVDSDKTRILTKLPFQKILALFVIGHIKITTPLIEKCQKFGVALVVMKLSFRPVFFYGNYAEANYLLRRRQYEFQQKSDISIAKIIVENKIINQLKALTDTRKKDEITLQSRSSLKSALATLNDVTDYDVLMGIEGTTASAFFKAFYQDNDWHQRRPRTKCDALNVSLDIGYTMLFNYIECFLRMFGFDLYMGVYHCLWFKRKSLVCDIMEPFRPIIDKAIRTAWHKKMFINKDFIIDKGEYRLRYDRNGDYCKIFFDALIPYKTDVFKYVQSYYRCFMGQKPLSQYPFFKM